MHRERARGPSQRGRSAGGQGTGPSSDPHPQRGASPRPGPARWRRPASRPRPTRPGPQSQSLSRSYGSNLPTSLTYISLSTRGSSPWRPAADMGTSRRDASAWPSPGFSRSEGTTRTPPQLRCSSRSKPYLPARGFQGTRTLMQNRKLCPGLPTASPGPVGLPRRAAPKRARRFGSAAGFRNRNRIPFRPTGGSDLHIPLIDIGFLLGLRID